MDALTLAKVVYSSPWAQLIAGLIAANVLVGLANALFNKRIQFYMGSLADWLTSRALPYLLCWGAVKLVALVMIGDYVMAFAVLEAAVSGFVIGALVAKILDTLREMGLPVPRWAGDKPRAEATATP